MTKVKIADGDVDFNFSCIKTVASVSLCMFGFDKSCSFFPGETESGTIHAKINML